MTISSDDDLRAAANRVADTLITHAAVMAPGWGGGPQGIRALVAEHATRCMTLDPQKIINEVDRVRELVKEVDPSRAGTVHDSLDEASGMLQNWSGSAAESFRARVRDLEAFSMVQSERSPAWVRRFQARRPRRCGNRHRGGGKAAINDTRDALVSPLPSTTRISSPDFRYEAFATDSRPAAEFGPAVTEEKRRMRPAPARRSAISTRLAGESE